MSLSHSDHKDPRLAKIKAEIDKCALSNAGDYSKYPIFASLDYGSIVDMAITSKGELWIGFPHTIEIYKQGQMDAQIDIQGELKQLLAYKELVFVVSKQYERDQLVIYNE